MAHRTGHVVPLWLGAIASGLQTQILQNVKNGLTAIELISAAWTDTSQSFITLKSLERDSSQPKQNTLSRVDLFTQTT